MEIKYLRHTEINKQKWDKSISIAYNGNVFAYSWYLDIVSYNWDALVYADYQIIMPLTWQRRLSLSYILQPEFATQLGIFSTTLLTPQIVESFVKSIPEKFVLADINLNVFNTFNDPKLNIKQNDLHALDLITPYQLTFSKYTQDTKDKINEAKIIKMQIMKHLSLKDLMQLYQNNADKPLGIEQLNVLRRIIPFTISNNIGEIYGTYNNKNQLVAAAYFIKSHNKTTCLLWALSGSREQNGAILFLFDNYINENSEKPFTLNFESSDEQWKNLIYAGLGAAKYNIPRVRYSKLPLLSKLLK